MNNLTATLNQIGQVCRLYWVVCTSSFGSICTSIWVVLFGLVGMLTMGPRNVLSGASVVYSVGALIYLLKRQVVHIRERGLPHAIGPHVFVWVVLLFLFTFGVPLVRLLCGDQISLAMFGIISTIAAFTIWGVVINRWWLTIFPLLFIFLPFGLFASPDAKKLSLDFFQGKYDGLGLAMFAMGIAGITFGVLRLLRISEEDRGYYTKGFQKPEDYSERPAAGLIDREAQKAIWQSKWMKFYDRRAKTTPFWKIWAQGNLNQRANLWAVGRGANQGPILFPLTGLGVMLIMWLMSGIRMDASGITNIAQFYLAFPIIFMLSQLDQQRSIWPTKLLMPTSRRRFFLEIGWGLAKQLVSGLCFSVVIYLGVIYWLSPDTDSFWKATKIIVVTAAVQLVAFGTGLELLRYRSRAYRILTTIVLCPAYIGGLTFFAHSSRIEWVTVAWIVLVSMFLGIALTYDAYRRWLQTELG